MHKLYWYELIHRPISLNTQPDDFSEMNRDHINRNGFAFGKVAYSRLLSQKELSDYQLEPVHIDGLTEISLIDTDVLSTCRIRMTVEILYYLIEIGTIQPIQSGTWQYLDLEELKEYAAANFSELKKIYKELKKVS